MVIIIIGIYNHKLIISKRVKDKIFRIRIPTYYNNAYYSIIIHAFMNSIPTYRKNIVN